MKSDLKRALVLALATLTACAVSPTDGTTVAPPPAPGLALQPEVSPTIETYPLCYELGCKQGAFCTIDGLCFCVQEDGSSQRCTQNGYARCDTMPCDSISCPYDFSTSCVCMVDRVAVAPCTQPSD